MAQPKLPAQPFLQLNDDKDPVQFSRPALVSGQPDGDLYPLPKGFQSADLANPFEAPKALGDFFPKSPANWSKG